MSGNKFKTHCTITDYIDSVDPNLSHLLKGLCVTMSLTSLKGKPGITFLWPQDKGWIAKLEKLAYSDKVEDATRASEMLNNLIIRDVFKTPAEWMAKKDDIPNSLFPSQHIEVDSASAKEVVFKSGAKAVIDTDFKDASRKTNLAVWKLTGEIPVTNDKPAKGKYLKRGKAGGSQSPMPSIPGLRSQIAGIIENEYILCRLQKDHHGRDPYTDAVLSLLYYIMHIRQDENLMWQRVLPLLSLDKLDFYLLLEPFQAGSHLLDDALIEDWWSKRSSLGHIVAAKAIADVDYMLKNGSDALIYTDRMKVFNKISLVRKAIASVREYQPRNTIAEIEKYYAELESSNKIMGLGPILPEATHAMYASERGLKMLHDELRFITATEFARLESRNFDSGKFCEIKLMIQDCLSASGADRTQIYRLLRKNTLRSMINPGDILQKIGMFVESTMFMYIPLTKDDCDQIKKSDNPVHRPDPEKSFMNIQKFSHAKVADLGREQFMPASVVVDMIRSLDAKTLDPAILAEIRQKFQ